MKAPEHVLITGASSGIGAALAEIYARPGTTLSLAGRHRERLDGVARACTSAGAQVDAAIVDVTRAQETAAWVSARDAAQPIDLAIANAGLGGAASLAQMGPGALDADRAIFDVNTLGVVHTIAPLIGPLARRGRGRIALVASLAALIGLPHAPAYSASKAAVAVYGDALRRLLAPHGVGVSVIYPGYVDTPMSASLPVPRTLLWSCDRAAAHIARELARGRRHIVFPRSLALAIALTRYLPAGLVDAVLARQAARDLERIGRERDD